MDRTVPPPVKELEHIVLPKVRSASLECGIQVFYVNDPTVEAFKIEAVTKGGFLYAQNAAQSVLSSKMLLEGTTTYKGKSLIEHIDSLGSFLEATPSFDYSTVTLFGLTRYFTQNIDLLRSVMYEASFESDALKTLSQKEVNRLKLNQEKGSYLSSINLRKSLFGDYPYGYHLKEEDILNIKTEEFKVFCEKNMDDFDLFLSGNLPANFLDELNKAFQVKSTFNEQVTPLSTPKREDLIIRNERFIQSSIRLGKVLFNRSDPDYLDFLVLNEILGGYFGSRLMKNIREEKGYTYGISSHLYALQETGYFTIGTEVNFEAEADTLIQIQKEIEILQQEIVPIDELKTVKNYILGSFTNSLSAPFAAIDKFKVLHTQGYDLSFYNTYIDSIKSVSQARVQDLANKLLSWESLSHSIVGK